MQCLLSTASMVHLLDVPAYTHFALRGRDLTANFRWHFYKECESQQREKNEA